MSRWDINLAASARCLDTFWSCVVLRQGSDPAVVAGRSPREEAMKEGAQQRAETGVGVYAFQPPYPPQHGGVGPLFELRVRGEAVPHDEGRVVLVPQLRTALEQEVYDEELNAGVQAWRGENVERKKKKKVRKT